MNNVVNEYTGEVIAKAGEIVTAEMADSIQNAAVTSVLIQTEEKISWTIKQVNLHILSRDII